MNLTIVVLVLVLFLVSLLIGSIIHHGHSSFKNRRKQHDRRNVDMFMEDALERRKNIPNRRKPLAREVE